MNEENRLVEKPPLEKALDVLNKALAADQLAIEELVAYRVYCDESVPKETPVVTFREPGGRRKFGVLGLINAAIQTFDEDGDSRRIGARYDHYGNLASFEIVDEKEEKAKLNQVAEQLGHGKMKTPIELDEERQKHKEAREKHAEEQRRKEAGKT